MDKKPLGHRLDDRPISDDIVLTDVVSFDEMTLTKKLQKGLKEANYITPTKMQSTGISTGKSGADMILHAKSGTGKTLVFCIIILEKYDPKIKGVQSLVLTPTREIAVQVEYIINEIGKHLPEFRAESVMGGRTYAEDRMKIQKAKCVVGTTGRIMYLLENGILNTSQIRIYVLDEVDKMYSNNFQNDLKKIERYLPVKRQTIASSATISQAFKRKLKNHMLNPIVVSHNEFQTTALLGVKQFITKLNLKKSKASEMMVKIDALRHIFHSLEFKQCLVFAKTQSRADSFFTFLESDGWPCELLSGALDLSTRLELFQRYQLGNIRILITTDLMSRGVDSEYTNMVINLDLPDDVNTYLHRIGRAGRFGSYGLAFNFVASEEDNKLLLKVNTQMGNKVEMFNLPHEKLRFMDDFWNIIKNDEECEANTGLFVDDCEHLAPLASQETDTSLLQGEDDNSPKKQSKKLYQTLNKNKYKDSAINDLENQLLVLTLNSNCSSSTHLPSSNTIDDASSIAADSLRSSKQISSINGSTSKLDKKDTLTEQNNKDNLKTFKGIFDSTDESEDAIQIATNQNINKSEKIAKYKSLLFNKSTQVKKNYTDKDNLFSDYETFMAADSTNTDNTNEKSENLNRGTFILSVPTPSCVNNSYNEEIENISIRTSEDIESLPEIKHFPSPAFQYKEKSIPDVVPIKNIFPRLQTSKLEKRNFLANKKHEHIFSDDTSSMQVSSLVVEVGDTYSNSNVSDNLKDSLQLSESKHIFDVNRVISYATSKSNNSDSFPNTLVDGEIDRTLTSANSTEKLDGHENEVESEENYFDSEEHDYFEIEQENYFETEEEDYFATHEEVSDAPNLCNGSEQWMKFQSAETNILQNILHSKNEGCIPNTMFNVTSTVINSESTRNKRPKEGNFQYEDEEEESEEEYFESKDFTTLPPSNNSNDHEHWLNLYRTQVNHILQYVQQSNVEFHKERNDDQL